MTAGKIKETNMRKSIVISRKQNKIIKEIVNKHGYLSDSEFIRDCINEKIEEIKNGKRE